MIKKRYLIVLTAAIVSILLGSLLYSNLALAGKPQPSLRKDAVEIDILGWITRQWGYSGESKEWGIYVRAGWDADLAFVFNVRQILSNITNIVVVTYATGAVNDFTLSINGAETNVGDASFPVDLLSTKLVQLNPDLIQINEGINSLRLSGSGSGWLSVYKVTVFIEYQYQA